MIVQDFTIDKYNWTVRVYYTVSFYPIEEIVEELVSLGCAHDDILDCIDAMEDFKYDTGSLHSNLYQRRSIAIIGPSSSAEEFSDTLTHEIGHLTAHIAIADNIDPFGEEIQYLAGYISKQAFVVAEKFLCSHCREELFK